MLTILFLANEMLSNNSSASRMRARHLVTGENTGVDFYEYIIFKGIGERRPASFLKVSKLYFPSVLGFVSS